MVAHILKPFHEMTGIECVASHAEPDEEEEVSDYEVMRVCVCVCVRARARNKGILKFCVYVRVCACAREK